jgi:hypothetical protein
VRECVLSGVIEFVDSLVPNTLQDKAFSTLRDNEESESTKLIVTCFIKFQSLGDSGYRYVYG